MFRGTVTIAVLVAVAACTSCRGDGPSVPFGSSRAPANSTSTTPEVGTSGVPATDASATTAATANATTIVAATTVTRPYVADPEVCVATSASEIDLGESNDGLLRPFALSLAGWHRFQVIADPELGVDGRWALVGTIPATTGFDSATWDTTESDQHHLDTINGWPVAISTAPSGYTDASIDLGGETDAYVRTYRFDLDAIRSLIVGLSARPPGDPIGFDYAGAGALPGLEMVLDRGDEPVDADIAVLECVADGDAVVRIASITGDALAQYAVVLDQPYPIDIGRRGESVVSIVGVGRLDDPPRLSDVSNAPDDVWARLLSQLPPPAPGATDGGS